MNARDWLRIGFDIFVVLLFLYTMIEAMSFSRLARYLPLYASMAGLATGLLLLAVDLRRTISNGGTGVSWSAGLEDYNTHDTVDRVAESQKLKLTAFYMLLIVGYVGLAALLGLPLASVIFLAVFLRFDAGMGLVGIAFSITGLIIALWLLTHFLALRWPANLMGW